MPFTTVKGSPLHLNWPAKAGRGPGVQFVLSDVQLYRQRKPPRGDYAIADGDQLTDLLPVGLAGVEPQATQPPSDVAKML